MATAMEIFNLPSEQVTREMRRAAKSVVFGIVYGISPFGLASNIGVSQADAKKYIETFFEKFAAVRALMDQNIEDGKDQGVYDDDPWPPPAHSGIAERRSVSARRRRAHGGQ